MITFNISDSVVLTIFSVFVTLILAFLGWGIRVAINRFNRLDRKVDSTFGDIASVLSSFRTEIKEYLKDCVRNDTCKAHRDNINKELNDVKAHIKFGRRYGDAVFTSMVKHFNDTVAETEKCDDCAEQGQVDDEDHEPVTRLEVDEVPEKQNSKGEAENDESNSEKH